MVKTTNLQNKNNSGDRYTDEKQGGIKEFLKNTLLKGGPVIALILLSIYLSFATPHFLTGSNIINIARQTSITMILAIGQTLVIITGGIDLSVRCNGGIECFCGICSHDPTIPVL